jgi:hypothetical protein
MCTVVLTSVADTLQQWQFADWMPIGWQAPQAGDLSIPSEPPLSPMLTHRTDSPAQSVFAGQSAPPLGFPYDAHFLNGKGRRPRWDSAPISTAPQQFQGHQSSSGQYVPTSGAENLHYEQLDPSKVLMPRTVQLFTDEVYSILRSRQTFLLRGSSKSRFSPRSVKGSFY